MGLRLNLIQIGIDLFLYFGVADQSAVLLEVEDGTVRLTGTVIGFTQAKVRFAQAGVPFQKVFETLNGFGELFAFDGQFGKV